MLSTIQFTRFLKRSIDQLKEEKKLKSREVKSAETLLCLEDKQKYSLNRHFVTIPEEQEKGR